MSEVLVERARGGRERTGQDRTKGKKDVLGFLSFLQNICCILGKGATGVWTMER